MSRNRFHGNAAPLWASQNFLTGRATIERLLCRAAIDRFDHVIEIGPGKGHLTGLLARRCGRLCAVELDAKLYEALRQKFAGVENLRLYHADFLQWRLPGSGDYKVFANIPFSCTTAIVRKLTECKNPPREAWLTMEKGDRVFFTPQDRIGQLTMRNLDILDSRDKLRVYHETGLMATSPHEGLPMLPAAAVPD